MAWSQPVSAEEGARPSCLIALLRKPSEFLFLSRGGRMGTGMRAGRGGLIKNPNKTLQPLVARARSWAQAFLRPAHRGALTNIPGASACPWLHYDAEGAERSSGGAP